MTIEQLLELPPEGLEALSDEKLTELLSPYFAITRPKIDAPRVLTPANSGRAGGKVGQKAMANAMLDRVLSDPNLSAEKLKVMKSLLT